jgi:lysozyme family protein
MIDGQDLSKYPRIFRDILEETFLHEGGYVNDPDDRGGETKYGISKRAFPDVDIKGLTKEKAAYIYYIHYWEKAKCSVVDADIRAIYFDMCVNFGIGGAVRVLQETANSKGAMIKVDGKFGPNTAKAIRGLNVERVRAFRLLRFAKIVISKPNQKKYWFGWYRRCIEV